MNDDEFMVPDFSAFDAPAQHQKSRGFNRVIPDSHSVTMAFDDLDDLLGGDDGRDAFDLGLDEMSPEEAERRAQQEAEQEASLARRTEAKRAREAERAAAKDHQATSHATGASEADAAAAAAAAERERVYLEKLMKRKAKERAAAEAAARAEAEARLQRDLARKARLKAQEAEAARVVQQQQQASQQQLQAQLQAEQEYARTLALQQQLREEEERRRRDEEIEARYARESGAPSILQADTAETPGHAPALPPKAEESTQASPTDYSPDRSLSVDSGELNTLLCDVIDEDTTAWLSARRQQPNESTTNQRVPSMDPLGAAGALALPMADDEEDASIGYDTAQAELDAAILAVCEEAASERDTGSASPTTTSPGAAAPDVDPRCSACDLALIPDDRFCPNCGAEVTEPVPSASPTPVETKSVAPPLPPAKPRQATVVDASPRKARQGSVVVDASTWTKCSLQITSTVPQDSKWFTGKISVRADGWFVWKRVDSSQVTSIDLARMEVVPNVPDQPDVLALFAVTPTKKCGLKPGEALCLRMAVGDCEATALWTVTLSRAQLEAVEARPPPEVPASGGSSSALRGFGKKLAAKLKRSNSKGRFGWRRDSGKNAGKGGGGKEKGTRE